jgi:putative ABC transport system permease protein
MNTLLQDLKYGLRMLWKNPGFTAVAVLSLALGIGATSAIFSVMNTVMYRPLPYLHPQRLVTIWETRRGNQMRPPVADVVDWRKQNDVFQDIGLISFPDPGSASGLGRPETVMTPTASPNFFKVLGAKPALGRVFLTSEAREHTKAILISNSFWKSHFNSDPKALGRSFTIDGAICTIVGVMPPKFMPIFGEKVDVWQPVNPERSQFSKRTDHWLMPVARLKPGVTLAQAQAAMEVIARHMEAAFPETHIGAGLKVVPLHDALYSGFGRFLYPLLGAVGFVLLIACLNIASLLQSRAETRRKEFAVRASLGAGRRRLAGQLLVESGILGLAGGCLGIGLAFGGIQLFLALAGNFPMAGSITVDGRVLLFTIAISLLSVLVVGFLPAIQASRPDLNRALQEGERRTAGGSRGLARHVLVIAEVGLAMVLLVGAGLMVNTVLRLQRVDPGFNPENVLTMHTFLSAEGTYWVNVPGKDWKKPLPSIDHFHHELLERIASLPGVASVGIISGVPTQWIEPRMFSILGRPAPNPSHPPFTIYDEASPGYFRTLRIPLIKGRYLDESDTASSNWVAVVNEAFVHHYFPKQDPIGQQILMQFGFGSTAKEPHPREIVGVVGNVKRFGLAARQDPPFVYASYFQQPDEFPMGTISTNCMTSLVIRTASGAHGSQASIVTAAKRVIAGLDPDLPVTDIMTMDQLLAKSTGNQRFYLEFLGIFAGLALLLALVGIYGVMSYFVTDRTHEIGIRIALGAQRGQVLRLALKQGLILTLIGVGAGIAGAVWLTRFVAIALYGVKPTDPLTFIAVSLILIAVALLACYIPARRAARVDPMVALRYE